MDWFTEFEIKVLLLTNLPLEVNYFYIFSFENCSKIEKKEEKERDEYFKGVSQKLKYIRVVLDYVNSPYYYSYIFSHLSPVNKSPSQLLSYVPRI